MCFSLRDYKLINVNQVIMSNQSSRKHPFLTVKVDKKHTPDEIEVLKSIAAEEFNLLVTEWLQNKTNCIDMNNGQITNCDCFSSLLDNNNLEIITERITEAIFSSKDLHNHYINEVIGGGYAAAKIFRKHNSKVYMLSKFNKHLVFCKHTACFLLNIGRRKYQTITKQYVEISKKAHGNIGNIIDKKNISTYKVECELYIKLLASEQGEQHATRFMREHHKIWVRDTEVDTIELPSYYTKRRLYRNYCWDKGWQAQTNARGDYEILKRPACPEDTYPPEGPHHRIVSWTVFRDVWKTECPHIRIRPPCHDTCDMCYEYKMIVTKGKKSISDNELTEPTDDADDIQLESNLLRSAAHIAQARAQRTYVNECIRLAKQDYTDNLYFYCRRFVITFDYAQNLGIPHFGDEQPGDTYYFSPLNLYVFGVANNALPNNHLHGYLYHEGEGKKGAVNVASMVMHYIKTYLIPADFNPRTTSNLSNKITFVADNCIGQNKNNTVIRLANLLVEGGYFATAEVAFLVKGHTKNSCDRSFNLMKQYFHGKNVYTKSMALSILNTSKDVSMIDCTPAIFKDYDTLLDKLYKRYPPSTIMKGHLFTVHHSNPSIVTVKAAANYENAIQIQLAKDIRKAPIQIHLPIPPFITAALYTGITDLTVTDAIQPDKREENLPPPSSLPNPIPPSFPQPIPPSFCQPIPPNDSMIYTVPPSASACPRPSAASAVPAAAAASMQTPLPTAAPPDINENISPPPASACPRPSAASPNPLCLPSMHTPSASACPRPSAASAVPAAAAASTQTPLPTAAPPAKKRKKSSVELCLDRLISKVEKKVKEEQQKMIENLRRKKNRQNIILDTKVVEVIPPCIPDMKQVDLFNKYRRFVPDVYRESICPEPTKKQQDEVKAHRKDTATKRKEKLDRLLKERKEGKMSGKK